jgi:hypothetical protein
MKCIPPEVRRLAEEAERRKDEAIARVALLVGGEVPRGDPFERRMEDLIEADRKVVSILKRKA